MSFTTPSKSSSQIPSSPLAKAVVSFNPENQSLVLYEYPAYSDANGVSRPILAEDLAQVRASNTNVVFPSCWCLAAFTGEYCETIIFTMSPLANAKYENPGKLALRCAVSQPKLRLFGCGFFIPIQQLTSQGALGNPLHIPAPGRTKSASSLLHALDKSFVGSSKRKFAVEPNGSPKKSRVLAPDSDTNFSPPPIRSRLEKSRRPGHDVQGSFPPKSTIEEFFQGTATFSHPSLHALEEAYTSGRGISLQEFRYLTDYCLDCGKVFTRLAHNKHLCFEVSQTQPRRMRIPKMEKGKEKKAIMPPISFILFRLCPFSIVYVRQPPEPYHNTKTFNQYMSFNDVDHQSLYLSNTGASEAFVLSMELRKPYHFSRHTLTNQVPRVFPIMHALSFPSFPSFFNYSSFSWEKSRALSQEEDLIVSLGVHRLATGSTCVKIQTRPRKIHESLPNSASTVVDSGTSTPIADPSTLQDGHPDAVNETGHTLLVPQNEINTPGGKKTKHVIETPASEGTLR
ncbi:hypothetical protein EDD18DRAFT_1112937 [Armillaria luteobubalina]|uniref:Uncharacterized protein n=1 Tax=Armillaria luteobubalina TaxID=153913 RepID=A0AA39UGU3_9AGAR|nr:hypothetical protein EDD18DRAFT_1112937 [Armillaria luteobubalina]